MKWFVLTFLLFSFSFIYSQNLEGKWKGSITQEPNREFYFEITIDDQDRENNVSGTTFIREEKSGNFGTIKFTGRYSPENQNLHFRESEIVKEDKSEEDGYWGSNTFYWCIKKGDLRFSTNNNIQKLQGKWTAPDGCPPGKIEVSRKIKVQEKNLSDCLGNSPTADFMYGLWQGTFNQYSCGVHAPCNMMILIDEINGLKFSGVFIWTAMKYSQDSRSVLNGEIKDGKIYFYEPELIHGGPLVLNGVYISELIDCDNMKGIWKLNEYSKYCTKPQVLEKGGDYKLTHYKIPTIYFDHDKSILTAKSKSDLDSFADFMNKFPSLEIRLSGHTDNTGSNARNMNLSAERATIVKEYLKKKGISSSRLKTAHHAHMKPAESNSTQKGKMLNRRTEIKILSR